MNYDFNDAPEQRDFSGGPIPPDSAVLVKLTIRQPKPENVFSQDAAVFRASSGLLGLDCEFEVVSGQFAGKKIWELTWLPEQLQQISLSKGQVGACQGGVSKMRAILEATRGITPTDMSDAAKNARRMDSFLDLDGLIFGVIVGVQKPKAGDQYVNNSIKRIITIDRDEYQTIMHGGEIITDKPIPEIPQGNATQSGSPAPGWGQQQQQTAPQAAHPAPQQNQQTGRTMPNWGQGQQKGTQAPLQQGAFPSESSGGTDDLPF